MTFDSKLGAYVIDEAELKNYSISFFNKLDKKTLIDVSSTKNVDMDSLSKIYNKKVRIRVRGGYDKKRAEYWSGKNDVNPNIRKGKFGIKGLSYYEDCNIYTIEDIVNITAEMKKIESGIMPEWSPIKKALYVYDRLREEIIYHPRYETQSSYEIRTLRGLISKRTVCAGYAMIYKEIMDRLGIECHYVEGCTTEADSKKDITNHAWNLLKIDGRFYPVDLTWDATRYRQGQTDSFNFFSNLQLFRKTHFPCSIEKIKDYSVLSGIKSDFVNKTIKQFKRKKDFLTSVIRLKGDNDEDIRLVQTNIEEKENEKPLYRYVMATKDKDGNFKNYRIIFSEANFLKIYNGFLMGKYTNDSAAVKAHIELFSYENVDKYLKQGTTYIGNVVSDKKNSKGYRFEYDYNRTKVKPISYKEEKRATGEHFLINESMVATALGRKLHFGSVSSFSERGFRSYKVVSNNSLLNDSSYGYINDFLDEDRLDRKVREAGGYIGYYNNGVRTYDPRMNALFSVRSNGNLTLDDIVPPTSVSNDNGISKMSLSDLEKTFYKYDVKYDQSKSDYVVFDRKTKKEYTDEKLKSVVMFSRSWFAAAGVKWTNSNDHGETYAFNEGATLVFDYLTKSCIDSLETRGTIDFDELSSSDMEKRGYSKYKHTDEIISNFVRNPNMKKSLYDFCNLQTEIYYSEEIKRKANDYNDSVNSELLDMFNDNSETNSVKKEENLGKKS